MTPPKYRQDIKGEVKKYIQEFEDSVYGELHSPETQDFILIVEDSYFYKEYSDYLTHNEMNAAFKRACERKP